MRHINKGAKIKGVYTESRWEYPKNAVREVIRNAVVHRDYSLHGKDIKIVIYDDLLEITSPGKLLPSIDFNNWSSRQSDIRNRTIAPIFKKIGLIDQLGNGLKTIADDLLNYPEIKFLWKETGMQFQIQFVKQPVTEISGEVTDKVTDKVTDNQHKIMDEMKINRYVTTKELADRIGISQRKIKENIRYLKSVGLVNRIGSEKTGHWEVTH